MTCGIPEFGSATHAGEDAEGKSAKHAAEKKFSQRQQEGRAADQTQSDGTVEEVQTTLDDFS